MGQSVLRIFLWALVGVGAVACSPGHMSDRYPTDYAETRKPSDDRVLAPLYGLYEMVEDTSGRAQPLSICSDSLIGAIDPSLAKRVFFDPKTREAINAEHISTGISDETCETSEFTLFVDRGTWKTEGRKTRYAFHGEVLNRDFKAVQLSIEIDFITISSKTVRINVKEVADGSLQTASYLFKRKDS